MKKLLASLLAASTVLSLSVASFAAGNYQSGIVDGDGEKIDCESGATVTFDLIDGGVFDVIHPDQTFYIPLDGNFQFGTKTNFTFPAGYLADKDLFSISTKDKDGDASKLIKITQEDSKSIDGQGRKDWLKVDVGQTMTSDEMKGTMTLEFSAKNDFGEELYRKEKKNNNLSNLASALNTELGLSGSDELTASSDEDDFADAINDYIDDFGKIKVDMTFWVNNTTEDGEDADVDAGDAFVYNPVSNEENLIIWNTENGERASLKFDADDDADKFYAKLSIKSNSSIYAEYGDPVGADLWFYDFVGSSTIPATSRATLTLGIPWDEDDDYVPASPKDCYIYRLNSDGTLEDVTSSFTYNEDGDIDGWSTRTRELGTFIVSDLELDIDVAGAEEVTDPDEVVDTETPDKVIPSTGSSDMVNVAVVAGVVSLAAAGAVAFRKVK